MNLFQEKSFNNRQEKRKCSAMYYTSTMRSWSDCDALWMPYKPFEACSQVLQITAIGTVVYLHASKIPEQQVTTTSVFEKEVPECSQCRSFRIQPLVKRKTRRLTVDFGLRTTNVVRPKTRQDKYRPLKRYLNSVIRLLLSLGPTYKG